MINWFFNLKVIFFKKYFYINFRQVKYENLEFYEKSGYLVRLDFRFECLFFLQVSFKLKFNLEIKKR